MIMNNSYIVREDVYEFKHLQGSTPSTYWGDVRTVIGETEALERSPSPKGLPAIGADSRAKCHTPGLCGDSPIHSPGLPLQAEARTFSSSSPHPQDVAQMQTFFVKPKTEMTQKSLMDKLKQTRPIHRGLIEAVQEPTPWKLEKRRRVENAIRRVNNNYVVNPRTYEEPDLNGRVDNQFMPTPPTGPKHKVRKNNRVIFDPEKMLKERGRRREEFAPSRPTMYVQESCYGHAAQHVPHPPSRPAPFLAFEQTEDRCDTRAQSRSHTQYDIDMPRYEMFYDDRSADRVQDTVVPERPQAWSFERSHQDTQERIQQEYVDEIRMEDEEEPTSSQAEIDLDIKRQQLLEKKKSEKKKRRKKRAELMAAKRMDDDEMQPISRIEDEIRAAKRAAEDGIQAFVPAPPSVSNTTHDSYSKRKRQLRQEYAESAFMTTHDLMAAASQSVNGSVMQPRVPAPPATSNDKKDSYSKKKRHLRREYGESVYETNSGYSTDARQLEYMNDMQPHVAASPSTNYDTSDLYYNRTQHHRPDYAQLEFETDHDYTTHSTNIEQRGDMQPHAPSLPTASYDNSDSYSWIRKHNRQDYTQSTFGTSSELIAGISTTIQDNQQSDEPKQSIIPGSNRPNHGPAIRVEPQLTWSTSAAKRGLGFKSKLRREQEEAARHNTSHQDDSDTRKKPGVTETKLSEEARRKWKNKTFYT